MNKTAQELYIHKPKQITLDANEEKKLSCKGKRSDTEIFTLYSFILLEF